MNLSSPIMQLIFGIVLLLIVDGHAAENTIEETTTNSFLELEMQDYTVEDPKTGQNQDIEEDKTINPPSLENDTNVNYVKNISKEKLAEVDFSTYSNIEIPTTILPTDLEIAEDTLELGPDFDKLGDDFKESSLSVENDPNVVNTTEKYLEIITLVSFTNNVNGKDNNTNIFKEDSIDDNVILDRIGLAADYSDDYEDRDKSKTSPWKPIWPFASIPSFNSTPLPANVPRTVITNAVTTVKSVRDEVQTISKEPITAYYFDITNTPLPAVGPLHHSEDIYGSERFKPEIKLKETNHYENITEFIGIPNPTPLISVDDFVIETTPVIKFSSRQDSSKLSDNVYSILNDGFDQNGEEFSVTFSTIRPPIKEIMPTMTSEKLQPKRVTDEIKTSIMNTEKGITSAIITQSSRDFAHSITTVLSSPPAQVSVTLTSKDKNINDRTPLWVRLSGKSSSLDNSTVKKAEDLHTLSNTNAPSTKITSIATNEITPTYENILHNTQTQSPHNTKNSQKKQFDKNALSISDDIDSREINSTSQNLLRDSVEESFSTSNSTSTSHLAHSTSNSISDISVSEEEKEVTTPTKPMEFDANFVLESSMRNDHISRTVTETPVIIPTKSSHMISNKSSMLADSMTTTDYIHHTLLKSDSGKINSNDAKIEDGVSNERVSSIMKIEDKSNGKENITFDKNLVRNLNGTNENNAEYSTNSPTAMDNSQTSTGSIHYDQHHDESTSIPIEESIKTIQEEEIQDEYEDAGAQISKTSSMPSLTSVPKDSLLSTPTPIKKTVANNVAKHQAPGEMVLPTTERSHEINEENGFSTESSILIDKSNMIKTVIKHLPGKKEPELKIIEMHSNGTNISKPTPYLKAALSYGVQDFCRHQGNIRSLLGEWVNNHLKNGTDSTSYEVEFFAQPNCSNLTPLPEGDFGKTKTILYFYVMDERGINPNITRQYPKNPTNLEISKKLAYLKEKILHLELVNAITYSEDLALEEAAVGTSILAIIISTIILLFVVISAALTFIIVKRRRAKDQAHGRRCTPAANDTYSMDSVSVFYNSFRRKSKKRASNKSVRSYLNQGFDDPNGPSRPLNFGKLTHFISDTEGIYDEFLKIPSVTPKYDEMPKGVEDKNRYANVIPVPETRVFLKANAQTAVEEYINANFIHGARGEAKYYIAAQAPLDETVPDFWQMIWEQESKVIVMLTDFVEKGIDKCADYLPPSETLDCHRVYGDFQVTLKSRDMREKYVVSQVQLKNLENNLVREIAHMWFTGWPERGIPKEEKNFISYIFETRAMRKKLRSKGPILVHCSPGTGRSGTFIGCDISMRNFDDQKSVDIPKTVWRIRRERAGAVQTKEQYAFIYRVTNQYAAKLMTGNLDVF